MGNIKVITNRDDIVAVANAIRSKIGETKNMTLGEMASNIQKMSVGSGDGGQDLSAEIAAQKELIAEIYEILGGKDTGGDGSGDEGSSGDDAESTISTLVSYASGRIPEYERGYAFTELASLFTTSAVGAVN